MLLWACRTGRICGIDEAETAQSVTDRTRLQSSLLASFSQNRGQMGEEDLAGSYSFFNVVSCPPAPTGSLSRSAGGAISSTWSTRSRYTLPAEALQFYSLLHPSTALYSPLQPSTALYSPLQPSTALYSPLQPICSPLQPSTALYSPLQPSTAYLQPSTALYSPLQPSTALYSGAPRHARRGRQCQRTNEHTHYGVQMDDPQYVGIFFNVG
jgi:hypothetical protein